MTAAIVSAGIVPFELPLRAPWRFGPHRLETRRGWLVRLADGCGRNGWGEATPLSELGMETTGQCRAWLERRLPQLTGCTAETALSALPAARDTPPAARCGLETALLDLAAQAAGRPLARYLCASAVDSVAVNANLGAAAGVEGQRLDAVISDGVCCIKLKVGVTAPELELARIRALAARLPAGVRLRLDANRAWSPAQAAGFLQGLAGLPVELVEEPLGTPDAAAWRALRRVSPVPLALDESLTRPDAAEFSADARVLKPMLHGGLLPCLALAGEGAALVTTTLDGAVATFAAAHLAFALDRGLAHGLATSGWLARDLAPPPLIRRGRLHLPRGAGLGCVPAAQWRS